VRRLRDGEITETPSGIGGTPATVATKLLEELQKAKNEMLEKASDNERKLT
jgi:hypothetical protein